MDFQNEMQKRTYICFKFKYCAIGFSYCLEIYLTVKKD